MTRLAGRPLLRRGAGGAESDRHGIVTRAFRGRDVSFATVAPDRRSLQRTHAIRLPNALDDARRHRALLVAAAGNCQIPALERPTAARGVSGRDSRRLVEARLDVSARRIGVSHAWHRMRRRARDDALGLLPAGERTLPRGPRQGYGGDREVRTHDRLSTLRRSAVLRNPWRGRT